ncbi:DinB family protein [Nocardioides sp. KIGAM211]|uniref:DinB family protein n=1 Tax=Nocardioides luti TaxID=2761101 RepID=A0A7X0RJ05_9ACTN|nr:DinB family protein [Nocardioides luti]MBB6629238.1 DinB family protein [Nocardioides luti]
MPAQAPPVADERSALAAYLVQQQDAFRAAIFGLTDEQAGTASVAPSTLTVGSLLKHVTQTQDGWLQRVLAAPGRPDDTRTMEEQYAAHQDGWTWHDHDTVKAALAAYDEVCAQVQAAVAERDLDTPVPVPPAPWNPTDIDAWSVRWVWFHLIEELARHAGHADLVREAVDGATMYELVAGREGWPETDWLKPWRPAD